MLSTAFRIGRPCQKTCYSAYLVKRSFSNLKSNEESHGSFDKLKDFAKNLTDTITKEKPIVEEQKIEEDIKGEAEKTTETIIDKIKEAAKQIVDTVKTEVEHVEEKNKEKDMSPEDKVESVVEKLKDTAKKITQTIKTETSELDEQLPVTEDIEKEGEKVSESIVEKLKDTAKEISDKILHEKIVKEPEEPETLLKGLSFFKPRDEDKAKRFWLFNKKDSEKLSLGDRLLGSKIWRGKKDSYSSWIRSQYAKKFGGSNDGALDFIKNGVNSKIKSVTNKITAPQRRIKLLIRFGLFGLFLYGIGTSLPAAYLIYVLEKQKLDMETQRMRIKELRP